MPHFKFTTRLLNSPVGAQFRDRHLRILSMEMIRLKGAHWRVTKYGLETIIPNTLTEYAISAVRLLPIDNPDHDWQVHVAQKSWVDAEQFFQAFDEALETHRGRYRETIDRSQILKNREIARAKAAARRYKPGDYVDL